MIWQLFAILAAALWAGVNIVDKHIVSRYVTNPLVMLSLSGVVSVLIAVALGSLGLVRGIPNDLKLLAILGGMLNIVAAIFYFRAITMDEISRLAPLFHVLPLFTALFAAVFLGEVFTTRTYIGVVVIVVGAILLSPKETGRRLRLSKAFWLIMLAAATVAIGNTAVKHTMGATTYWTVLFYIMIGQAIALVPVLAYSFADIKNTVRLHGKKVIKLLGLMELMDFCATFLFTMAMFLGYVTLVNSLAASQPLFLLLFAFIASRWFPKILREEVGTRVMAHKLIAVACIVGGVLLIS